MKQEIYKTTEEIEKMVAIGNYLNDPNPKPCYEPSDEENISNSGDLDSGIKSILVRKVEYLADKKGLERITNQIMKGPGDTDDWEGTDGDPCDWDIGDQDN